MMYTTGTSSRFSLTFSALNSQIDFGASFNARDIIQAGFMDQLEVQWGFARVGMHLRGVEIYAQLNSPGPPVNNNIGLRVVSAQVESQTFQDASQSPVVDIIAPAFPQSQYVLQPALRGVVSGEYPLFVSPLLCETGLAVTSLVVECPRVSNTTVSGTVVGEMHFIYDLR